jgi:hypothetical protein
MYAAVVDMTIFVGPSPMEIADSFVVPSMRARRGGRGREETDENRFPGRVQGTIMTIP